MVFTRTKAGDLVEYANDGRFGRHWNGYDLSVIAGGPRLASDPSAFFDPAVDEVRVAGTELAPHRGDVVVFSPNDVGGRVWSVERRDAATGTLPASGGLAAVMYGGDADAVRRGPDGEPHRVRWVPTGRRARPGTVSEPHPTVTGAPRSRAPRRSRSRATRWRSRRRDSVGRPVRVVRDLAQGELRRHGCLALRRGHHSGRSRARPPPSSSWASSRCSPRPCRCPRPRARACTRCRTPSGPRRSGRLADPRGHGRARRAVPPVDRAVVRARRDRPDEQVGDVIQASHLRETWLSFWTVSGPGTAPSGCPKEKGPITARTYYLHGYLAGRFVATQIDGYKQDGLSIKPDWVLFDPEGYPDNNSGLTRPDEARRRALGVGRRTGTRSSTGGARASRGRHLAQGGPLREPGPST